MNTNLLDYRIVLLKDIYSGEDLGAIYLNNKHTTDDFQNAINRAKETRADDIAKYGDDWSYISDELIKEDFDFIEVDFNSDEYVEY